MLQNFYKKSDVIKHLPPYVLDAIRSGGGGNAFQAIAMDAAVAGGMAFLQGELEKRDPKVREPLSSVTWQRDIVANTGGGWVDFSSIFNSDFAIAGANTLGIIGGESNAIPIMQTNIGKDIWPVWPWANVLKVAFIDMQKAQGIGRSLDQLLDTGIRLNWNKALDWVVYRGFGAYAGLTNNDANVTTTSVLAGTTTGLLDWAHKTPSEKMIDINYAQVYTWGESGFDLSGMCNQILIPPAQYADIANTPVTSAGSVSILTYLEENNIGAKQGVELKIFPCRWCTGTTNGGPNFDGTLAGPGAGGTDRMIAYVNEEDCLYFDITVPIQRVMTMPDVKELAYLTAYAGQFGPPKFARLQPVAYFDGI
jgi:hypothetical protein